MKCDQCGKEHTRRRFCCNLCKDRFHNTHNPRGLGLAYRAQDHKSASETDHEAGMDAIEAGWDGHKNAF